MTYLFRRLRPAFGLATLVCLGSAHASDIDCDPANATAGRPAAHRLICESALFSMGYQRIVAEQQRLLQRGSISEDDIAAFRHRRDGCDSASCLDTVLREWKAFAANARARPR